VVHTHTNSHLNEKAGHLRRTPSFTLFPGR